MNEHARAISRGAGALALFALICAGLIAVTHAVTDERIRKAEQRAQTRVLAEVVPAGIHDNDLLDDSIRIPPHPLLGTRAPTTGYVARRGGQPVALILTTVAPDGYSGEIRSIVGIGLDGRITGVRVVSHKETPGLGDKIERRKSDWILAFDGKSLADPAPNRWAVVKDGGAFDQLTGATITPRAVVGSVKNALLYFRDHRDSLLTSLEEAVDDNQNDG